MNDPKRVVRAAATGMMALALIGAGCGKEKNVEAVEHHPASAAAQEIIVRLDRHKVYHAGIIVENVARRSVPIPLVLPGKVTFNEKRIARIAARVGGRVEQVNAFTNDRVREHDVLVQLTSQEFVAMQSEFIQASLRRIRAGERNEDDRTGANALYESSRRKLRAIGVIGEDIARLEASHTPQTMYNVRAPFNGTIIESSIRPGVPVQPGADLFLMADLHMVWVLADIYESDLPHIRAGMIASVGVDAYPDTWKGTVASVYGVVDEKTRTVKARIEVNNRSGALKPGMFCTVSLQASLGTHTIKIPSSALLGETEKHFVFVAVNDTTFERRDVRTGVETRDFAEILDGVLEGERIVVKGGFFLKSELAREVFGEEH